MVARILLLARSTRVGLAVEKNPARGGVRHAVELSSSAELLALFDGGRAPSVNVFSQVFDVDTLG